MRRADPPEARAWAHCGHRGPSRPPWEVPCGAGSGFCEAKLFGSRADVSAPPKDVKGGEEACQLQSGEQQFVGRSSRPALTCRVVTSLHVTHVRVSRDGERGGLEGSVPAQASLLPAPCVGAGERRVRDPPTSGSCSAGAELSKGLEGGHRRQSRPAAPSALPHGKAAWVQHGPLPAAETWPACPRLLPLPQRGSAGDASEGLRRNRVEP